MVIPGLRPGFHGTPARGAGPRPVSANQAIKNAQAGNPGAWAPPAQGWQQAKIANSSGGGDDGVRKEKQGLIYAFNPAQIWAAYDSVPSPPGGGVRALTREQLMAAFKKVNGIELDPGTINAIYDSVDPSSG